MSFIESLSAFAAPHVTTSGFVVDTDVHFIGQGRHWQSWEVADIGVILTYRRASELLRTKVALLQSKRLYPRESEFVEDEPLIKLNGFGDLLHAPSFALNGRRVFRFDRFCRYRALQVGDDQWRAIGQYEDAYRIPVHYMLYHPRVLPTKQEIPAITPPPTRSIKPVIGCRIIPARELRLALKSLPRNYAPSYGEIKSHVAARCIESREPGWRVETFVSEHLLDCREGYIANDEADEGLTRVFTQRGAPIAAALRIDINAPEETELIEPS